AADQPGRAVGVRRATLADSGGRAGAERQQERDRNRGLAHSRTVSRRRKRRRKRHRTRTATHRSEGRSGACGGGRGRTSPAYGAVAKLVRQRTANCRSTLRGSISETN